MNTTNVCFALLLALALSACANLNTVERSTSLPGRGDSEGKAIHLDAKQRLAFGKAFGIVCAEPSPDALSAAGSGVGAGASKPGAATANLSAALSEAAGGIGLRTQSITMMRDALYRVCELYYGRALNSAQVWDLHQYYQKVMVAVLAIEQLTGAVKATQVAVNTGGGSSATSSLNDIEAALAQARETESKRDAEVNAAQTELTTANSGLQAAEGTLAQRVAAGGATPSAAQQQGIDTAQSERDQKLRERDAAQATLDLKQQLLAQAKDTREALEEQHGKALVSTSATAVAGTQFSGSVNTVKLDAASTEHIAKAVENIVKELYGQERIVERCMTVLEQNPHRPVSKLPRGDTTSLYDLCLKMVGGLAADDPWFNPRTYDVTEAGQLVPKQARE